MELFSVVATVARENVETARYSRCTPFVCLKSSCIVTVVILQSCPALVCLIRVITKHIQFHVHTRNTTATATSLAPGSASTLSVKRNVERNATDLHVINLVTSNCLVVTGVLDSVESGA